MKRPIITVERLRELLDYNPKTGDFRWRVPGPGIRVGAKAGSVQGDPCDRIVIQVDMRRYRAHRLAWLWMTGKWPKVWIDHWDRNPANNRWKNLREATRSQNRVNTLSKRPLPKGVYPNKDSRKPYRSAITINNVHYFLGRFYTIKDARAAYLDKARKHFGEFVPES